MVTHTYVAQQKTCFTSLFQLQTLVDLSVKQNKFKISPSGNIIKVKTGNLFVVHSAQLDKNYSEAEYDARTIQWDE